MSEAPPAKPDQANAGCLGCLIGFFVAVGLPIVVFFAILMANARNPQCGTPADEGGCEMGVASGVFSAIVIGLICGIAIVVGSWLTRRSKRPRDPDL